MPGRMPLSGLFPRVAPVYNELSPCLRRWLAWFAHPYYVVASKMFQPTPAHRRATRSLFRPDWNKNDHSPEFIPFFNSLKDDRTA